MGKRSNFERKKNDFYPTPMEAVLPLIPHISANCKYIEPCVGKWDLVNHLNAFGMTCVSASDIEKDVCTHRYDTSEANYFITNPPWTRQLLHPLIDNLRNQLPTWLLFDAGWMHTKQSVPFMPYCAKIVSVGRVKWIPDSPHGSLDDSCWYLFIKEPTITQFVGRN